jgi:hypothetical protein
MSTSSPRLGIGLPDEREEPYFQTGRNRDLGWDAGVFANAENSQTVNIGGGNLGWDADATDSETGVLFWSENVAVANWSTPFKAIIEGPASVELTDGEVLFYVAPRLMRADTVVELFRSNRVFLEGTRIHDLRWFAVRVGTTIYFQNGLSLKDEDIGLVFGGGLFNPSVTVPHDHKDALKIEPPSAGVSVLDVQATSPDLKRVFVYRNGFLQSDPDDYSISLATGLVTLVVPTLIASERFIILRECQDAINPTTTHDHLPPLVLNPIPLTTLLDMLVSDPLLNGLELFRNGLVQAEPDDFSLDTVTGFVTLVQPTVLGEKFLANRRINI